MRVIATFALLLVCDGAVAQPGVSDAISALNKAEKSKIEWNAAKARQADVTCDGRADTVLFGTGQQSVWVGVVSSGGAKPQIQKFSIARDKQDGFCAAPKSIMLSQADCIGAEDGSLPDCKPVKTCRAFALDNGDCDAFHFYWDSRHKLVRWWRN